MLEESPRYLKARKTDYDELNRLTWEWSCTARSKGVPVTGRLIQEKALMLSLEMGHDDFTASNGWLQCFQKRHNIRSAVLHGEAASVSEDTVADWKQRLPSICEGYELADIFNADETGLFYRTLPDRSMVLKGHSCHGGKRAKDRITVLLACSATGEKLRPLVIGKANNPRCFKGYDKHQLPVMYFADRKAWMTSELFTKWLCQLNNQMQRQKRNVLLMIDNCGAHPDITMSNVKLAFLPPNTTSRLQPLDGGIIQCVKANYRKRMMRHIIFHIDEASSSADVARSINVLDAIQWAWAAWDSVPEETIQRCFANCGFTVGQEAAPVNIAEPDENFHGLLQDVSWEDFVSMDNSVETSRTAGPDWEQELLAEARGDKPVEPCDADRDSDDPEGDTETPAPPPISSAKEVSNNLLACLDFALHHQNPELVELMSKSLSVLESAKWDSVAKAKQSSITSFFKAK